ncbi:hypothetical protein FVEN_g1171 [Fusarium venenatum]|uniref:Apple domain-containing protein n=1 Tax=Fusarium venenatum TaxID=56646 RepID=A0A2L2U374_9HYPO|nr:uncharacterized protein FVRRES_10387 [Fusarium venenatum]KAG8361397.1 hypothetical protein FVEN_g1171 [Fusarium venenatum]KAH6966996.1 hypothetical protein EDB82DRAFT_562806 [Fusarium venenatum]CEI70310.1 unnamed protein product [Fusarium venenatum]
MALSRSIRSFLFILLFVYNTNAAPGTSLPHLGRRDDAETAVLGENTTALEPVVPPEVDPKDFSIFELDTHVMLAWAGSPGSEPGTKRMRKRDDGIFSQANFTFQYPVVPLDHSKFVSTVTCTKGTLTGVISHTAAYNYAKSQWKGSKKIIFITSTDGCGEDHANDLFLAQSITFFDDTNIFVAKGATTEYADVYERFTLNWGPLGTLNVRRALDKRAMFEPHALDKRGTSTYTLEWNRYLHDADPDSGMPGPDPDAPWDSAAKLIEWGSEGGEKDDSYAKGEVADPNGHHKRGDNSSLIERDLSYGLVLYCVECGFSGKAQLTGTIEASILSGITVAEVGFQAQFKAGLNLGLKAFVKYEKEWSKDFIEITIGSFGIYKLFEVGPYIGVGIEAGITIEATGTLLIGASVEWENIDILVDFLDDSRSHSNGLKPVFKPRSEATGELKLEASLGLPVSAGVKLGILFDYWTLKGGVRDTPSVVLEGSFEANAVLDDNGDISTSIEGDCYGIAWNIHFENALDAFYQWDDDEAVKFPLIEPLKSDPIAEGCIGYVNDGTGGGGSGSDDIGMTGNGIGGGGSGIFGSRLGSKPLPAIDPTAAKKTKPKSNTKSTKQKSTTQSNNSKSSGKKTSSSKTTGKTNSKPATNKKPQASKNKHVKTTTTTKPKATVAAKKISPTCTPYVITNAKPPSQTACNRSVTRARAPTKSIISTTASVKSVSACAETCLKNKQCMSFGYNTDKSCQLYSKVLKSLGVAPGKGKTTSSFNDRNCYAYSKCSK